MPSPDLLRTLTIPFEASLLKGGGGFGHFRGHHAGIVFGARMLELGAAAIAALVCAAMATVMVSDWIEKRYGNPDYARAAGFGTFLIITLILGAGIARFV